MQQQNKTSESEAEKSADVQEDVTEAVQADVKEQKVTAADRIKNYFTATRITYIAIFTALSYVLYMFDFAILPAVNFLKIDFSNVFVMIAGFSLGPVAGVIVGVLKELIHALTLGNTAFVGELANILFLLPYLLIPAIIYKKHKGIKAVIIGLLLGCVAQCIISVPVNYFLNFPAFYLAFGGSWQGGMDFYLSVWYWAVLFNLIKTLIISAVVMVIYKPLSRLIKATNNKFENMKAKKAAR